MTQEIMKMKQGLIKEFLEQYNELSEEAKKENPLSYQARKTLEDSIYLENPDEFVRKVKEIGMELAKLREYGLDLYGDTPEI